eukprot:714269-Pyramimonas_sp.AAC.1
MPPVPPPGLGPIPEGKVMAPSEEARHPGSRVEGLYEESEVSGPSDPSRPLSRTTSERGGDPGKT